MQSRIDDYKLFITNTWEGLKGAEKRIAEANKKYLAILESYREEKRGGFFEAHKKAETDLEAVNKNLISLKEKKRALQLSLDAAMESYGAIIAEALTSLFIEGGSLFNIPVHYKKFKEGIDKALAEYKTESISVYCSTAYCHVSVDVSIGNIETREYVASLDDGCVSVNLNAKPRKVYEVEKIRPAVRQYIKLENIMLKQAEAFEKRAKEIRESFPYLETKNINKPHIIWGKQFLSN